MLREITYTLTEADYVTAQRTAFLRSVRSWRVIRAWLICVFAFGLFAIFLSSGASTPEDISMIAGFLAWGTLALPLCWALSYILIPRRAARLYRQQRSLQTPWTYRWSETGLENEGVTGVSRYAWNELHAWTRSGHMFLFYVNDILFHMLPTRVLSQGQADDVEAMLLEHGPQRR